MKESDITISSIIGANDYHCHILKVDTCKIMINCGTPNDLNISDYVDKDFSDISILLLSHMKINFIGALPFLKTRGFKGKIYATFPIKNIGRLSLMERCKHYEIFRGEQIYTENEIDCCFEEIIGIKFLQPIEIEKNIVVIAHNAGCTLGGSIWRVSRDTEYILYAVGFDHRKTNTLNGIDMVALPKNSIFIADCGQVDQNFVQRSHRNLKINELISEVLKSNAVAIIIVDYAEFLEIALLVDNLLRIENNYKAGCLGFFSRKFSEIIKTMIEWAGEIVAQEFMDEKENPFSFKNIDFYSNYNKMDSKKIIFVFEEFGFADSIFEKYNAVENLILNCKNIDIKTGFEINNFPVFSIVKMEKEKEKYKKVRISEDSEEEIIGDRPWYQDFTDIWMDNQNVYFPSLKTRRVFDEYNEFYTHEKFETKIEIEEEEDESISQVEIDEEIEENIELKNVNIKICCNIINYSLESVTDMPSAINVMEFLSPKKVILIPRNSQIGELFFMRVKLNKNFDEVLEMTECVKINDEKTYSRVILDEEFMNYNYKMIKNCRYLGFRGKVEDGKVHYLGPLRKTVIIGDLNMNSLKRSFIENNFEVEDKQDFLVIDNEIIISKNDGEYEMRGNHGILYYAVRNIIYKHITYF